MSDENDKKKKRPSKKKGWDTQEKHDDAFWAQLMNEVRDNRNQSDLKAQGLWTDGKPLAMLRQDLEYIELEKKVFKVDKLSDITPEMVMLSLDETEKEIIEKKKLLREKRQKEQEEQERRNESNATKLETEKEN